MTPLQTKVLAHLVKMAKLDKSYAWWAAKHYAELCPHELADIPQLLVSAMQSRSSNANATDTKDAGK